MRKSHSDGSEKRRKKNQITLQHVSVSFLFGGCVVSLKIVYDDVAVFPRDARPARGCDDVAEN